MTSTLTELEASSGPISPRYRDELSLRARYVSAHLGAADAAHAPHRALTGAIKAFAAQL